MGPYCSASTSASGTAGGGDHGSRPAGVGKKRQRTQLGMVSLAHLLKGTDAAPPGYLTLSLTPAGIVQPRRKQPGDVTLEHMNAPRDYLKLSCMPPAVHSASLLPPKKRKRATVSQETPACSSRSLELAIVVYGDDTASQPWRTHGGDGETRSPAAMIGQPIDAVPLQAVYNPLGAAATSYIAGYHQYNPRRRPEPAWIRETLNLPAGLRLSFIAHKRVERSDIDLQQSRVLIPRDDVAHILPLLSLDQLVEANLDKPWKRPPKQLTSGNQSDSTDEKKKRAHGMKHGGLVLPVYINRAGYCMDAELTRWNSNGNTVLKFKNYGNLVAASGLKVMDQIQIWGFQLQDRPHFVINKIDANETDGGSSIIGSRELEVA